MGWVSSFAGQNGKWFRSIVQGYCIYHAVPGNIDSLSAFRYRVIRLWWTMLIHRGQKHHLTWARMQGLRIDGFHNPVFSIHTPEFALTPFIQDKSLMR